MPSPFPGMDPFVERPDVWLELHNRLMVYICDAVQPELPENYVARLELRIYTDRGNGSVSSPPRVPDLELVRTGAPHDAMPSSPELSEVYRGGYWIESPPVERREAYVTIRSLPEGELVTAVELLSPANKHPGTGRTEYLKKQSELLDSDCNLVELDLLRAGPHTVAVDEESLSQLPRHDYRLCVRRSVAPWKFLLVPWTVRDPLPKLPVPLAAGDPIIYLPLDQLFQRAYDNAACRKLLDYRREAEPALRAEDAAWADEVLRGAGLRGDVGVG